MCTLDLELTLTLFILNLSRIIQGNELEFEGAGIPLDYNFEYITNIVDSYFSIERTIHS